MSSLEELGWTAPDGWVRLAESLASSYMQAYGGKGSERHGNGLPFDCQPILTIGREHGIGFLTGQAAKKLSESHVLRRKFGPERAADEIRGAIVYAAAAVILLTEEAGSNKESPVPGGRDGVFHGDADKARYVADVAVALS